MVSLPSRQESPTLVVYGGSHIGATGSFRYNTPLSTVKRECREIKPVKELKGRSDGTADSDVLRISVDGKPLCIAAGHEVAVHGIKIEAIKLDQRKVCMVPASRRKTDGTSP